MDDKTSGETGRVEAFLDSNLASVDKAEQMVVEAARSLGLEEDEQHKLGMAVREAVVNAVVHGNRYSAHKKVHLTVVGRPDALTTTIVDEGNGFDPSTLPDPLAQENLLRQSGRGLLLVRAFVDEFEVRRLAPFGTEVRLVKFLARKG